MRSELSAQQDSLTEDALQRQLDSASQLVIRLESEVVAFEIATRQARDNAVDKAATADAARATVQRAEIRLAATSEQTRETLSNAVGPEGDRAALTRLIADLTDREAALTILDARVSSLVDLSSRNEMYEQSRQLENERSEAISQLDGLQTAKRRLDVVSQGLIARANAEEQIALGQQRSAIQDCFRTLLPHSHLNEFEVDPKTGAIFLTDPLLSRQSRRVKPHRYLSTGQANALAVSIFVGIALRQRITPLGFLMMDEPVQNMDDVHFLAFISLIKRVALHRQVIFSTADGNIAEIFRRQMKSTWARRPSDYGEFEWLGFSPVEGPSIVARSS